MLQDRATVKQTQRQMRHVNASITLDTYAHLFNEDRAMPVQRVSTKLTSNIVW